jgi:hypothetical protein
MALVVLSKVEQRLDAVRAVSAGASVTDIAAAVGVSRVSVHDRFADPMTRRSKHLHYAARGPIMSPEPKYAGTDPGGVPVMTDTTPRSTTPSGRIPSARVVISTVYALCVLVQLVYLTLVVVLHLDPSGPGTARQEMVNIGLVGTTALVIGVLVGLYLARSESASRIGAIIFGALSLLTVVFLWSGAPGVLGAIAAWLGGLTRGRTAEKGAARVFAIIGLGIAILNSAVNLVWAVIGAFVGR